MYASVWIYKLMKRNDDSVEKRISKGERVADTVPAAGKVKETAAGDGEGLRSMRAQLPSLSA